MRSPTDMSSAPRRLGRFSRRAWFGLGLALLFVLFASLKTVAVFWTDQMWFSQGGFGSIFTTLFTYKLGLIVVFGGAFAGLIFGNLMLTHRLRAKNLSFEPEDEMTRRYQNFVTPYVKRIYGAIALVLGFLAGLNAQSQWKNLALFLHPQHFANVDPVFHKNIGFYVFTLPFLSFVVTWVLIALFVTLLVSAVFHLLNGGIRSTKSWPVVSSSVKVHLSLIGAAIAFMKAIGYLLAKWHLVASTNGYVQGAGYTDIHARIPALTILFYLSIGSALILLANVRRRGWSLPVVAVGLWAFVALVIGVAYPSILQAVKVSPNQASLETVSIERNIAATRTAYGITGVSSQTFPGATKITPSQLAAAQPTINNIRLWDPSPQISLATTKRRQAIRSYYTFTSMGIDRYVIDGKVTPVLIGARQLNAANLPSQSWVNQHLQFTHGAGVAVLEANQANSVTGNPVWAVGNVPPVSVPSMAVLRQAGIYFGIKDPGWVVANTKQAELDYQVNSGANAGQQVETHYGAKGGVKVGSFLSRAALALRLGDFNFLISSQITANSRVLFTRDIQAMVSKAAPFLNFDSQPYAVINNGSLDYVLTGYTTTDQYPNSQNASTLSTPEGGLPSSYNYARASVRVTVDAYTGQMTFYVTDPSDPIIRAYEAAFPKMFTSQSKMPSTIRQHLRYPTDLFNVQAAFLGRYHITNARAFYSAADRWTLSPSAGAGSATQGLAQNSSGTGLASMSPLVQVASLPGSNVQQLTETLAYVPAGNAAQVQGLTAFLIATSDPSNYGQLHLYVTPRGTTVTGPALADSEINNTSAVSSLITLNDQHGSQVLLGADVMIPLDKSLLYIRPFYVTASVNPIPQLRYVVAVYNQDVAIAPTLAGALSQVLGANVSTGGGANAGTGKTASQYLQEAAADYTNAQNALSSGNLADYQKYVNAMNQAIKKAQGVLKK